MPTNVFDARFRSFANQVIPVCQKNGVGVIGMKSLGGGMAPPFLAKAGLTAEACIRYALGLPVATLVVGITSLEQLEQAATFAARGPLPEAERAALLARIAPVAGDGRHEHYKTGRTYDGAFHRQQHGFEG
jgi:aryl-alcohol dehydrogenase-like predicted oxidoreductase